MPYIPESDRWQADLHIAALARVLTGAKIGAWNYAITRLLIERLRQTGVTYANLNELHGLLRCVDAELYRRMTAPYEDAKARENGDVFHVQEGAK